MTGPRIGDGIQRTNFGKDIVLDLSSEAGQQAEGYFPVNLLYGDPQRCCTENGIDTERRESIVNKTMISARTNRSIGGVTPSRYLDFIERQAQIPRARLDELLATHLVTSEALRADDFDRYFRERRENLCLLVENASGKSVQRDYSLGHSDEDSSRFDDTELEEPAPDAR